MLSHNAVVVIIIIMFIAGMSYDFYSRSLQSDGDEWADTFVAGNWAYRHRDVIRRYAKIQISDSEPAAFDEAAVAFAEVYARGERNYVMPDLMVEELRKAATGA